MFLVEQQRKPILQIYIKKKSVFFYVKKIKKKIKLNKNLPSLRTTSGWLGIAACFVSILNTCTPCCSASEWLGGLIGGLFGWVDEICNELNASDSEKSVSVVSRKKNHN